MRGRRMGRPGLIGTMARTAVVAGTATAVAGGVSRRGQRRAEEQQQPAEPPTAQQTVPQQAAAPVDRIAQLKELGELKSQGVLSDDEFAAEKAKILAS
jgi:hypothetical protein